MNLLITKIITILSNNLTEKLDARKVLIEAALKTGFCKEEFAGLDWDRDYDYKNSTLEINIVRLHIKDKGWIEKESKNSFRSGKIKISNSLNELLHNFRNQYPKDIHIFFELINFNSFTAWFQK